MDGSQKILRDIVGIEGYETLSKAIFRRGSQSVADPLELYLPLLVVPRAILSWLAQNITPMKVGEHKEIKFPGREDIVIDILKESSDVYRGEMIQGGKIIHSWEKQSMPAIAGHFMTVMEQYDHLKDKPVVMDREEAVKEHEQLVEVLEHPTKEKTDKEAKKQGKELEEYRTGTDLAEHIMHANGVKSFDGEEAKWAYAHANVKELVGVIGKLVDSLVAHNMQKDSIREIEVKVDDKIHETELPKPPKEQKLDASYGRDDGPPKCKEMKEGKEHAEPKLEKESLKEAELLEKPYVSEAQRRWAHTPKGKETLGGEKAVQHWDKESKGKDLPEKVNKDEIKPRMSAGQYFRTSRRKKMSEARQWLHEVRHGKPDPKVIMDAAVQAMQQVKKPEPSKKAEEGYIKSGSSHEPNTSQTIPNILNNASNRPKTSLSNIITKEELDKAGPEKPSGAGIPKGPTPPIAPKPPVPAGKNPAASAQKQAQASARGQQAKPPTAPMAPAGSKGPMAPKEPKIPSIPKNPALKSEGYFLKLRSKGNPTVKSEKEFHVTEQEIFQPCEHCGVPEFKKNGNEAPIYTPCACFKITLKDENGQNKRFLSLKKKEQGYSIQFAKNTDPDTVRAFLLTLQAKLLLTKRLGRDEV